MSVFTVGLHSAIPKSVLPGCHGNALYDCKKLGRLHVSTQDAWVLVRIAICTGTHTITWAVMNSMQDP